MSSLTLEDLEEIINSGDFEQLKGRFENEFFDCKKEPYQLTHNSNKRELAKDVSSFANTYGGYILIGIKARKDETHIGDKIEEINPIELSLINKEQILDICEKWIYPRPDGLDFYWVSSKENEDKGIAVIKIPPQPESLKPFLIKNVLDGEKQVEIMFGYAERLRDKSLPKSLRDIQTILRSGLNYEHNMKSRFDTLELLVQGVSEDTVEAIEKPLQIINREKIEKSIRNKLQEREKLILTKTGLINEPTLVFSGFVIPTSDATRINSPSEIIDIIQNYTQGLRDGGWTLLGSSEIEKKSSNFIETKFYKARNINIFAEGMVIYPCRIGRLAFVNDMGRIIPIALIEIVYQFVHFYQEIISHLQDKVEEIFFRIYFINTNNEIIKIKLPQGKDFPQEVQQSKTAPEDSEIIETNIPFDLSSAEIAFIVLERIYKWFGLTSNHIPYSKFESEIGRIDLEQLK